MSISRIVDNRTYNSRTSETVGCSKNSDCMFFNGSGCSAEWCIFERLPKMINTSKTIECLICGNTKTVSVYSGKSDYICDDCKEDIKKLINNPKCEICGTTVSVGKCICNTCRNKIKEKINE